MGVQLLHFSAENLLSTRRSSWLSWGSSSRCPGVSLHPNPVSRSVAPPHSKTAKAVNAAKTTALELVDNKTAQDLNATKTMAVATLAGSLRLNLELSTNSHKTVEDPSVVRTMEERREPACRSGLPNPGFLNKLNSRGKNGWKLSQYFWMKTTIK